MTQWRTKGRTPDVSFPSTPSTKVYRLAGCGRLSTALDSAGRILDPLPADVLVRHSLPNLHDAIHEVHFPTERARLKAAMRRLIFHELFLIQAGLAARKARVERTEVGGRHRGDGSLLNPFLQGSPSA